MPSEPPPVRALVIDDEEIMLESCRRILARRGLSVDTERDPFAGRERALSGDYDLLLLDVRMPDLDGFEILREVRERRPDVEVIMITGYSSIGSAVQAVKLGAFDYLPKPFTPEELWSRVDVALAHHRARHAEPVATLSSRVIGDSEAMRRVTALVARVAPTEATVLLTGEGGTGKELLATEIHALSNRRRVPLVSLDCAALAPALLEAELFGSVEVSAKGALASKPGLFGAADHGTLFLDEVGSLGLAAQGRLLRVLETGEVKPLGGTAVIPVDVRVIAATSRDLEAAVREHSFREDLYYRLGVVPIALPPLRERQEDIPLLLHHLLSRYQRRGARQPRRLAPAALDALTGYAWPGNVRELKNLAERLIVTTDGDVIEVQHLPGHIVQRGTAAPARVPLTNEELKLLKRTERDRLSEEIERAFVIEALKRNAWNVSRASKQTGMLRPNFHALMRKHRIRAEEH
jgi:DNA-binding NtrC family response regulator